jgi:hypothetical protein
MIDPNPAGGETVMAQVEIIGRRFLPECEDETSGRKYWAAMIESYKKRPNSPSRWYLQGRDPCPQRILQGHFAKTTRDRTIRTLFYADVTTVCGKIPYPRQAGKPDRMSAIFCGRQADGRDSTGHAGIPSHAHSREMTAQ